MKKRLQKFYCDRAFMKAVLVIAIPLMLQQLIASSVNLVDNLMVGQLGDEAIGAVAAVNRYYIIALFGTNGLCTAASVFIAQYYGAKEPLHMQESFRCMTVYACVIMTAFCLFGVFCSRSILLYFTSDPEVVAAGISYIQIAAWSFIPTAFTAAIYNAMRAVGETKIPLRCSAAAVITNTILNYCLIFGHFGMPRLGVAGAAIATLIARAVELALASAALLRTDFAFKSKGRDLFVMPAEIVRKIIAKAAPLMVNEVMWSFGMATLFKFYSFRGSDVMSGYSIAGTIGDIFFTLFAGMAAASTVFISQPLGADRLDEARRHGYQLLGFSVILSVFFAILMFGSTFIIPFLYSHISPAAKEMAQNFLRVQSAMFWIYMATTQCYFTLRSGGDMKHTLIMDSGFMWLVNIPIVALVTYCTGLSYLWIYLVGQMTDLVKLVFAYRLVRKEKWVVNLTRKQAEL